jgi:hypothetical protein
MADYKLHGLNTRDFQHLVQAIARKTIAAGVVAFGDGKDGARDLTFRGRMDYPSLADGWNGYLIVGCKFNQKPTGNTKKDADWAQKQLQADLKKFTDKKRRLKRPEYYLFVTNVGLSGAHETGSRDRMTSLIEKQSAILGLKGSGVWDYNDLRGFLDGDADLRAAYGHFITAGDVLVAVTSALKSRPKFVDVMHAFLQKELIADTSAKLQSAGEDPESQIPLATVFVDLPFAHSVEGAVLTARDKRADLPNVVASLLDAGRFVLRRGALDQATADKQVPGQRSLGPRFVIVGGPGQGKSTFGQYLCQIYRAAILGDRPKHLLDERVARVIQQLSIQQAEAGGLPLTRRFPIRIELRTFSHTLAANPKLTLFDYIRQDISRLANAEIPAEDLLLWFSRYPWVLVLDGLDEVPPSSNRAEVLTQIDSLLVDAASNDADLLLVATTRPQSYSKEFSERTFRHLYLAPLSPSEALKYGQKLVEARCGADERRKDELVRSLEKACENPATSRLMQSPLQVTIMATLLEDTGEPPQQRYRLFAEYYRTIYRRETRRKLLGGILTERQKDVDTIHAQAGLLLHAATENASPNKRSTTEEVDSALSDDDFRKLVKRRLDQIGIAPAKASELLDRISDGSLLRLVFLVRQTEGWVRFDITSFKEFMAAEAIMTGSDDDVRERMRAIAPASYWRNVFQFAVGKCFLEREHLLDTLVTLCVGLNDNTAAAATLGDPVAGEAAKTVLWGSRVALDIVSDGTARQYPGFEALFTQLALQPIRLCDYELCVRLASVYHDDLKRLYQEAIEDRLASSTTWSRLGAWHLLGCLADRDVKWAEGMLDSNWPTDAQIQRSLLFTRGREGYEPWALKRAIQALPQLEPHWILHMETNADTQRGKQRLPRPLQAVIRRIGGFSGEERHRLEIINKSTWSKLIPRLYLTRVESGTDLLENLQHFNFEHRDWLPVIAGARFGTDPTAASLAKELAELAPIWESPPHYWLWSSIPWPMLACLSRAQSAADVQELARRAANGELGDLKDWNAAERRWRDAGATDDDFCLTGEGPVPWGEKISPFPLPSSQIILRERISYDELARFVERLSSVSNRLSRAWLASGLLHYWQFGPLEDASLDAKQVALLLEYAFATDHLFYYRMSAGRLFSAMEKEGSVREWIDVIERVGRRRTWLHVEHVPPASVQTVLHHFCSDPNNRRGLLAFIGELAIAGNRCLIPAAILGQAEQWDADSRQDALALRLAGNPLDAAENGRIARELVNSEPRFVGQLWRPIKMAGACSPEQQAQTALSLLAELRTDTIAGVETASSARRYLAEFLTKRPSILTNSEIWKRLKLPPLL